MFPPNLTVFRERRYKNDAFPVPTLFPRQLLLYGGINHPFSLLCFGNLPAFSALSFFGNLPVSLPSALSFFGKRRYRFALFSAPPLRISLDLTIFRERRYKNDAFPVPTLFSCQLFLSGGINHPVSLLCFGILPAFSALSFFGNLPVSLPSALSFFGKRRYRFALVSVPTLPISSD